MAVKRGPTMKWWDCHATWTGKNGAPVDLLYFVQARTRVGAVEVARGSLQTMFINGYKLKVRRAYGYDPKSKDWHWYVQRGPWVPKAG